MCMTDSKPTEPHDIACANELLIAIYTVKLINFNLNSQLQLPQTKIKNVVCYSIARLNQQACMWKQARATLRQGHSRWQQCTAKRRNHHDPSRLHSHHSYIVWICECSFMIFMCLEWSYAPVLNRSSYITPWDLETERYSNPGPHQMLYLYISQELPIYISQIQFTIFWMGHLANCQK